MKPGYLAAIDLGTNSFHLIITRLFQNGKSEVVTTERAAVRLGSGGDDMGQILPEARERGIQALKHFVELARGYKATIHAVATSALREAPNRQEFLDQARRELGLSIQVIEGSEEARLIYLGVVNNLHIAQEQVLVFDIGGGSTEFVIGQQNQVHMAVSLKLGAIRLTNRFFTSNQIQPREIEECRRYIRVMLSGVAAKVAELGYGLAIGSSGTAETLYEMIRSRQSSASPVDLDEPAFDRQALASISSAILAYPDAKSRLSMGGLDQKRADIIVGGVILLEEIFDALNIETVRISRFALREGVVADYINRNSNQGQLARDIRRHSVNHIVERIHAAGSHQSQSAQHTRFLAGRIFDQLLVQKMLPEWMGLDESLLLEYSAQLHNVGLVIAHSAHHKHSYYMIKNSDRLLGFSRLEIEIIAQICRYHRKKKPTSKHESFAALDERSQEIVRWLAGILRIAIGLDRRHQALVEDLGLQQQKDSINLEIKARESRFRGKAANIDLEIWAARNSAELLAECIGKPVTIQSAAS
ncbi:MAG: Ppx/GppA family phosphatase [Leptospiraceae bacterium]|nr:Ppx/GppA family phosphatase [Leptospiraceae bacterium]